MKYIFLLSGDYISLGAEEIVSLFDIKRYSLKSRLMIFELDSLPENKVKRLALTKNIYRHLFECRIDELIVNIKNFDWNSVYRGSFCLRKFYLDENDSGLNGKYINSRYNTKKSITNKTQYRKKNKLIIKNTKDFSEKNLAGHIWRKLFNPKVDLENPRTEITLFFLKGKVYCGLLIKKLNYDFDSRKAHNRPFPHPSSLHPKVARALVNLSGINEKETLLDPFCGTGGFLIEAGLMDIKSLGYDINKIMIKGCIENLKHFKISNSRIKRQNALKITDKFDCVVTDLPYGLNSNVISELHEGHWKKGRINKKIQKTGFTKDLEEFYLLFLRNLRKKMKKGRKAVIVFPDYADYKKLLKKSKFKIEKEFTNYVHGSLTRKMVKMR